MKEHVYEHLTLEESFPFAYFTTSDRQAFFHYHDCLELNLVKRGRGHYVINGKRYDVEPGDVFVINNREPHMAIHGEDFELGVVVFDMKLLWRNKEISSFLSPFFARKEGFSHRITRQNAEHGEMERVFAKISQEYETAAVGWQMAVESLLLYLLTLIYRCYDEMEELSAVNESFQRTYDRIMVVLDYLADNFREEIRLDDLAELVSVSRHYLCKCFKNVTGKTIFAYVEQMRVQYGCYVLRTSDESITDVALSCGFNSVNYFNRIFKKTMGVTPTAYRRDGTDGGEGPGRTGGSGR